MVRECEVMRSEVRVHTVGEVWKWRGAEFNVPVQQNSLSIVVYNNLNIYLLCLEDAFPVPLLVRFS